MQDRHHAGHCGRGRSTQGSLGEMPGLGRVLGGPGVRLPFPAGASSHALYVCLSLALARLPGSGSHCPEILPYPGPSQERTKAKATGHRPIPSWTPRGHPPRAPGTFRPARNTSNVQIPQVMREFVTRGAWAIQEWEPDQGPELETQPRPAGEGSGCSERAPREEERTAGRALWAVRGERSCLPVLRGKTAVRGPGGPDQVAICPGSHLVSRGNDEQGPSGSCTVVWMTHWTVTWLRETGR